MKSIHFQLENNSNFRSHHFDFRAFDDLEKFSIVVKHAQKETEFLSMLEDMKIQTKKDSQLQRFTYQNDQSIFSIRSILKALSELNMPTTEIFLSTLVLNDHPNQLQPEESYDIDGLIITRTVLRENHVLEFEYPDQEDPENTENHKIYINFHLISN